MTRTTEELLAMTKEERIEALRAMTSEERGQAIAESMVANLNKPRKGPDYIIRGSIDLGPLKDLPPGSELEITLPPRQ